MPTSQTDARAEAREAVEVAVAKSVWDALMQIDGWVAYWVADKKIMKHKGVQDALDALVLAELRALPCANEIATEWYECAPAFTQINGAQVAARLCARCKRIAELETNQPAQAV
jgi:hypothetical protein